jgi:GTP-binding protein
VRIASVEFVRSAASVADVPSGPEPQVALIGRSNVGKSSLINALVGRQVARTSAAPGKTRLINLYRVRFGPHAAVDRLFLVDLPGYGYARGGSRARAEFADFVGAYASGDPGPAALLLIVDARHPGLEPDVAAWEWAQAQERPCAIVISKIDKIARGQRTRMLEQWNHSLKTSGLPVSAATGEGLEDLWKLIVNLLLPQRTRLKTPLSSISRP